MENQEAIRRIQEHMRVHKMGQYPHVLIKEALDMAINALQEQEQRRWIPVSERLPNVFEGVLAYCPKRRNTYLLYINARGEWHFFDKTVAGALLDEAVTHWMPLPEPPKEGAE